MSNQQSIARHAGVVHVSVEGLRYLGLVELDQLIADPPEARAHVAPS